MMRNVFATVEHGYDPLMGKHATPMMLRYHMEAARRLVHYLRHKGMV